MSQLVLVPVYAHKKPSYIPTVFVKGYHGLISYRKVMEQLTVNITPEAKAALERKTGEQGQRIEDIVEHLINQQVLHPSLDELLAPGLMDRLIVSISYSVVQKTVVLVLTTLACYRSLRQWILEQMTIHLVRDIHSAS